MMRKILVMLFKGLDRTKIGKINELINYINEKDELLEKQEDLLVDEHDKLVVGGLRLPKVLKNRI
jgi:hypothetical protein